MLPRNLNRETKDLVKQILVPDPNMRIEIKAIKRHPFFGSIDWEKIQDRKISPPYVPPEFVESPNMEELESDEGEENSLMNQEIAARKI